MASDVPRSSVFDFPGDRHFANAFRIDAETLENRPIRNSLDFYAETGKSVTALILSGITEEDIEVILSLFTSIQHLTLENVQILNKDIKCLPIKIAGLRLIKCRIVKPVIEKWFRRMGPKLESISVSDSYYAVPLDEPCSIIELLELLPKTVRHLKAEDHSSRRLSIHLPRAEYVYLDIHSDNFFDTLTQSHLLVLDLNFDGSREKMDTRVLRLQFDDKNRNENVQNWRGCKQLKHLRIINPIPMEVVQKLQAMTNLKTLDTFGYPLPPQKEVKNILMLDDDCLTHIFSYLKSEEWISLMSVHPRFDHVVGTYILPNKNIVWSNRVMAKIPFPGKAGEKVLRRIGETVKSLSFYGEDWPRMAKHFKALKSLVTCGDFFTNPMMQSNCGWCDSNSEDDDPPEEESHVFLRVRKRRNEEDSVADFFRNLSMLLPSSVSMQDLAVLHNIREFTCESSCDPVIQPFLRSFTKYKQLELLDVSLLTDRARGCFVAGSFRECPMETVKELCLSGIDFELNFDPADFPSLEEFYLRFHRSPRLNLETEKQILKCISQFKNLKKLSIREVSVCDYKWLYEMKSLVYLSMNIKDRELLNVIKELPRLSKYHFMEEKECWTFEFEAKLREFLVAAGRSLEIYNGLNVRVLILP